MTSKPVINKCHGCEKRFAGCHSECDDYKKYREYMDNRRKEIHREVINGERKPFTRQSVLIKKKR